jgi:phosphatidylglycerophosphate synthase
MQRTTTSKAPSALIINKSTVYKVWGVSTLARLQKILLESNITEISQDEAQTTSHVLIFRADVVYGPELIDQLAHSPNTLLHTSKEVSSAPPVAANIPTVKLKDAIAWMQAREQSPSTLKTIYPQEAYVKKLHKLSTPICETVTQKNIRSIETKLFSNVYKGVTDLVTKYLWPAPAKIVTKVCATLGISPNNVTSVSAVLVVAAYILFANGLFGWGLVAGGLMTFLDTVDGKLARLTLTSSPFGNIFDHGIDLIHPPFWYIAWGIGLAKYVGGTLAMSPEGLNAALWVICIGYVVGRLCEGYFMRRFKLEIHVWRRFDSVFRLITARRNPNLILLTLSLITARPDLGLYAVMAWTVMSSFIHIFRIAQAETVRARGRKISSWLKPKIA